MKSSFLSSGSKKEPNLINTGPIRPPSAPLFHLLRKINGPVFMPIVSFSRSLRKTGSVLHPLLTGGVSPEEYRSTLRAFLHPLRKPLPSCRTHHRMPTPAMWTPCSPSNPMANTGPDSGSTLPATPIQRVMRMILQGQSGPTVTG